MSSVHQVGSDLLKKDVRTSTKTAKEVILNVLAITAIRLLLAFYARHADIVSVQTCSNYDVTTSKIDTMVAFLIVLLSH